MVNAAIAAGDLMADTLGPDALAADSDWSYMISFMPGLKSAGGTEQILRNTIGERVLGLAAGAAARQGDPVLRAAREGEGGGGRMNFALSDEQVFLREAARGALSRHKTVEAAREALEDPTTLPDLWPMAVEAGWPGLLIAEEHGGAGLGAFDALLVAEECGRVLASVPLLGLLPATAILNAAGDESLQAVAAGELRPVYVPARPPSELEPAWTVDAAYGHQARRCRRVRRSTATQVTLDGAVAFVPDAPGADLLVGDRRRRRRRTGRGCDLAAAPTACRSSR